VPNVSYFDNQESLAALLNNRQPSELFAMGKDKHLQTTEAESTPQVKSPLQTEANDSYKVPQGLRNPKADGKKGKERQVAHPLTTPLPADNKRSEEGVQKEKRDKTPEHGKHEKQKKSVKSSLPHALSDKLEKVMKIQEKEQGRPLSENSGLELSFKPRHSTAHEVEVMMEEGEWGSSEGNIEHLLEDDMAAMDEELIGDDEGVREALERFRNMQRESEMQVKGARLSPPRERAEPTKTVLKPKYSPIPIPTDKLVRNREGRVQGLRVAEVKAKRPTLGVQKYRAPKGTLRSPLFAKSRSPMLSHPKPPSPVYHYEHSDPEEERVYIDPRERAYTLAAMGMSPSPPKNYREYFPLSQFKNGDLSNPKRDYGPNKPTFDPWNGGEEVARREKPEYHRSKVHKPTRQAWGYGEMPMDYNEQVNRYLDMDTFQNPEDKDEVIRRLLEKLDQQSTAKPNKAVLKIPQAISLDFDSVKPGGPTMAEQIELFLSRLQDWAVVSGVSIYEPDFMIYASGCLGGRAQLEYHNARRNKGRHLTFDEFRFFLQGLSAGTSAAGFDLLDEIMDFNFGELFSKGRTVPQIISDLEGLFRRIPKDEDFLEYLRCYALYRACPPRFKKEARFDQAEALRVGSAAKEYRNFAKVKDHVLTQASTLADELRYQASRNKQYSKQTYTTPPAKRQAEVRSVEEVRKKPRPQPKKGKGPSSKPAMYVSKSVFNPLVEVPVQDRKAHYALRHWAFFQNIPQQTLKKEYLSKGICPLCNTEGHDLSACDPAAREQAFKDGVFFYYPTSYHKKQVVA